MTTALVDAFTMAMVSRPLTPPVSPTVLIADDDDDVRDVIAYKLQMAGFRTLSADNGRSALTIAKEQKPKVIVMDVSMPQLDGLAVCRELRACPQTAEVPVLIISGTHTGDAGLGDDFLPKPFSQVEMLRRVNWLLMSAGR